MTRQAGVYEKHNSFAVIRHRSSLDHVMERVRGVQERVAQAHLSERDKGVVRQACEELLGQADSSDAARFTPPHGSPARQGGEEGRTAPQGSSPKPRPSGRGAGFTLQSYVIEEMSRLMDAQLPRYLLYRFRYEMFPQRHILDEFPPCLQIEPASICNYRCVFCYQTDRQFTDRRNGHMGVMSVDLFKRLMDQAAGSCEAVTLASRGEPLLCPAIEDMLAYCRGKFLALKINTNASHMTEAHCHAMLQADVSTVVFSVDAASEPAYSRLRVGGSLECVRANVARFREIRAKHYPRSRTITRVSGVQVPETPGIDDMEAFWGELVDQVAFVRYNPWENTYERPVNDITTPCSDLWRRMFVWWDGTVNPCDVDYQSTLAMGNAREQALSELWCSAPYQALRERHLAAQRSRCAPCNRCTVV